MTINEMRMPCLFLFSSSAAAAVAAAAAAAASSSFPSYCDRVPLQLFHYVDFIYVQLQLIQYAGVAFIVYYDIATRMCVICSYFLLLLLSFLIHLFIHFCCYCSSIRFIFSFTFLFRLGSHCYYIEISFGTLSLFTIKLNNGHVCPWNLISYCVVCTVKMFRVSL